MPEPCSSWDDGYRDGLEEKVRKLAADLGEEPALPLGANRFDLERETLHLTGKTHRWLEHYAGIGRMPPERLLGATPPLPEGPPDGD